MSLPSSAWVQARERFLEDLEERERLMFAEASLENIFYGASAAQKIHQKGSRSRYLASKLDFFLAGINQYGKAMNIFSQGSAVLCVLWGSLRVIIHLSSQFQKYFTVLIDMFEQIGDVIPRFQAYETIFSSSPLLMQSPSNAYLNIINFCTRAKTTFQKTRNSVMNAKMLFKISWKSVDQQFETLVKDFRRHRKSVEKEAELAHLVEAEKSRAVIRANIQQQEKQSSELERIRLLSLLSSVDWEQQHSRILDMRHPGTGTWILKTEVFEQWISAIGTHQQRCLWCYGIPGSGKTVLTASMINALSQEVDRQHNVVAYFYCDYADHETLEFYTIIGTVIQQLLVVRPSIEEVIAVKIREAYGDGMRRPSPGDLIHILELLILDYHHCVHIIIDGVDEASPDTQEKLLNSLTKLSASCGMSLRLYFSTRQITLMSDNFPSCLSLDVSESNVAEDIEHYIKASVRLRLHCLPVILNHPYLEDSAVLELTAKAQGMFLWVSLQIEELCDPSHSERSFKSALQDLPEGLTATYERIFQKTASRSTRQKALAERMFDWTVCARRPLKFDELKDAVAVDLDDVSWDRSKISAETDEKRFLRVCGNLVVFHERDSTVRLAHHTVEQFLSQHRRDHSQADVRIGETCLTYLSFSDFETQVVSVRKNQDIFGTHSSRRAGFYRIPHILGLSNGMYESILGLYNRNDTRALPDVNYAELMRRYQKKPLAESLTQKYRLLDYVTINWIWHAKRFDPQAVECWSRFGVLVFHKALPFDFKPWGSLNGPSDLPHLNIFLWALENNHLPLLLLLRDLRGHPSLKHYLRYKTLCRDRVLPHLLTPNANTAAIDFHEYPNAYDWPVEKIFLEGRREIIDFCLQEDPSIISFRYIITRALKDANFEVINCLLRSGAKLLKTEIDATNALHNAMRRGNQNLVKLLLDLGADANSRLFQDERGRTPLYEAFVDDASYNHAHHGTCTDYACSSLDVIELLLDHGADPNARQIGEETALHKAVGLGEAYVRILLSRGADLEAKNDRQQSILELAVDASGRIIDVLVEYGVNLEARDAKGQTALLRAVQKKSDTTATVKTLIGHGVDVHAKDSTGKTVLHHFRGSKLGTLWHLLELGVDVNARDQSGTTALGLAVRQSDTAKFKMLLEFGAVFGAENEPPLNKAAAHGNKELVTILLRMGKNPNLLGNSQMSAISSAVKKQDKEIVTALLEAGADPNLVDKSYLTPLGQAVLRKDDEIGEILIRAGAVIQSTGNVPYSPIYLAIGSGDVHMLEFLIQHGVDVSSFQPRDLSGLQANHVQMHRFLTEIGVPFTLYNNADDDDDV